MKNELLVHSELEERTGSYMLYIYTILDTPCNKYAAIGHIPHTEEQCLLECSSPIQIYLCGFLIPKLF